MSYERRASLKKAVAIFSFYSYDPLKAHEHRRKEMKEEMNMESRKELNTPSEEKEALSTATVELNDEELTQVSGGKVNQKIKKFNNPEVTND